MEQPIPGSNGTGIEFPTLELGGKTYTIKFTRGGFVYRLSKSGTDLNSLVKGRNFAAVMDVLFAALYGQFHGTVEDLAELVLVESKTAEVGLIVRDAIKKVFPPTIKPDVPVGDATQEAPIQ